MLRVIKDSGYRCGEKVRSTGFFQDKCASVQFLAFCGRLKILYLVTALYATDI
jgi:hypothetical protein